VIVYDLICTLEHKFEGWFPAGHDYLVQKENGLLECPVCGDRSVERVPSAARINKEVGASMQPSGRAEEKLSRFTQWLARNFEDVGTQFPEEARRIHYGESPDRRIRGQASREEVEALVDEGVPVIPVPTRGGSELN
jgi:hypothetical protein